MSLLDTYPDSLDEATVDFVEDEHKMYIGGEWVEADSGEQFSVYDPATNQEISRVARANEEDVNKAVTSARQAFDSGPWRDMPPSKRGRLISRIGDLILEHQEEFAQLEALDNGKSITAAQYADVPLAADMFHYMAGWTTKIEGNTKSLSVPYTRGEEYHSYTRKEPIGVAGQIIPWNFPLLMAAWKVPPALAAGCTIVLKPAEETPLSALKLGEIIEEAGLPDGVVNIVTGYGEEAGAPLAGHDDVDKIAFTGSKTVGKKIAQAATGNLKDVTLELGGKSPTVVCEDADMEKAIPGAARAIFFNQGQACNAGSRLFIQDSVFDQVIEGVAEVAKNMKLGPGLDSDSDMGPLISEEQIERVKGYLDIGEKEGAKTVVGGNIRKDKKGYFMEPTVLTDTNQEMTVVREEIFGPVLTTHPFDEFDQDVIDAANDTPYGLASGIWTEDISKAHDFANRVKAGTVWVNTYNIFDPALPFGGYKQSGWGREMGEEVLESYTETKSVCFGYESNL